MGECWTEGTATFMILGNICTRSCGFCNVQTGSPLPADEFEPFKVARSINIMGVKHAVLTSVDRDDLKDGGSIIWAETVKAVRDLNQQQQQLKHLYLILKAKLKILIELLKFLLK